MTDRTPPTSRPPVNASPNTSPNISPSLSPLQRYARPAITVLGILGAIETAFLTWVELNDRASDVCAQSGCDTVLTSAYASPHGVPLPLFGVLAYTTMAIAAFIPRQVTANPYRASQVETVTSWILAIGGAIMAATSAYLMYVLATDLHALCPYCIASALFSTAIFGLAVFGREWEDLGSVGFTLTIVAAVTLTGALGVFADVATATGAAGAASVTATNTSSGYTGAPITRHSDPDSIALAQHLTAIGAQQFGAYWCPHCYTQKQLFGLEAFAELDYVECAKDGAHSRSALCQAAGVRSFPTWNINGELYEGITELDQLADWSDYTGSRNFAYTLATIDH